MRLEIGPFKHVNSYEIMFGNLSLCFKGIEEFFEIPEGIKGYWFVITDREFKESITLQLTDYDYIKIDNQITIFLQAVREFLYENLETNTTYYVRLQYVN